MAQNVPVTLTKNYLGYNAGETAGFSAQKAKELVDSKYAVPFVDRAAVQKEAPAKKEKRARKKGGGKKGK